MLVNELSNSIDKDIINRIYGMKNHKRLESNSYPHPYRKGKGDMAKDIWKYDSLKREVAVQNGYDYLIIWDSEYKQNKEIIIQECIDFLNK